MVRRRKASEKPIKSNGVPAETQPLEQPSQPTAIEKPATELPTDKKTQLELEKLREEIHDIRQARRWTVNAVRNVKLTEWIIAAAALTAFCVALATGVFDATRQHLAAQHERQLIEKIHLEQKSEKISSDIAAKEKDLESLKKRLAPFEDHESSLVELRELKKQNIHVSFSIGLNPEELKISIWLAPPAVLMPPYAPPRNGHITKALRSMNRLRNVKKLAVHGCAITHDDILAINERKDLNKVRISYCGLDERTLMLLNPSSNFPSLRGSALAMRSSRLLPRCGSIPVATHRSAGPSD